MTIRRSRKSRNPREAGQATIFVVLMLGMFLLGGLCLAFDFSNMWFHRQAAQSAADAACTAGAMDLLVDSQGGATGNQVFTPGTGYTCSTTSKDSICSYAALNGYNSDSSAPGNEVDVSWPSSVIGVATPGSGVLGGLCSTSGGTTTCYPFVRVDITDNVQTFFFGLLNGGTSQPVRAFSTCGVIEATAPIPLLVLDPRSGDSNTLSVQGTPTVSIYGGPQRSIEVNSSNTAAVNVGGSAKIDLSLGGPNNTGSDLGVYGGPTSAPTGFKPGATGNWIAPAAPISDPFAPVAAPSKPTKAGKMLGPYCGSLATKNTVCTTVSGIFCPDAWCYEYTPGYYDSTSIQLNNIKNQTAIFDPGIYYVTGGFFADSNSCLYPSGALGDGSGGTLFYFTDTNSVNVTANSGKSCFAFTTESQPNIMGGINSSSLLYGAGCTSSSTFPKNMPTSITGNVLLGPCQAGQSSTGMCDPNCGINYGDPQGTSDPLGEQRGFLFFQDRAMNTSSSKNPPSWQGGGQTLLSGTMYFHQCVTSGSDTGTGCSASSAYNDDFTLGGNSGSGTYILGEIVADEVQLGGTSAITMDLNPNSSYSILKASLLQ